MRSTGQSPTPLPHAAAPVADAGSRASRFFGSRGAQWIAMALAGALLAAAVLLWARYGATVFFDTLSAGIGACM